MCVCLDTISNSKKQAIEQIAYYITLVISRWQNLVEKANILIM